MSSLKEGDYCHSKVRFEKAFDKIEHQVMLTLMKARGFAELWINWMETILWSRTSVMLFNGVPAKLIHCKRVRQGDPLSPLLVVMAANFVQSLVNKAKDMGLLKLPISLNCNPDFPIIQYADDTLIILEGEAKHLHF